MYRVIEVSEGIYQTQFRFLFVWHDSHHPASRNLADQIEFARPAQRPKVVWPTRFSA